MNPKDAYRELREQVYHHDTVLEGQNGRAKSLLAVSAVLLGIMGISLGNFAGFVHENYVVSVDEPETLPIQAIVATMILGMAGLAGAMISMIFSVRALYVSRINQPIMSKNFGKDGNVDSDMLDAWIKLPEREAYTELIKSCVSALHSREENIARIGARAGVAQSSLLAGLILAGTGAMVALSVFILAFLPA